MHNTVEFNLNGSEFWHYSARDRHGSSCAIYMVDKKSMEKEEFNQKIREIAGPAALLLREHLYSYFLWGKRMETVFDEKVEFTLNGKTFSRLLHTERKFGKGPQDHSIDGEAVSVKEFKESLDFELKSANYLIYDSLLVLHPDYQKASPAKTVDDSLSR
jgi:hypothetical protein